MTTLADMTQDERVSCRGLWVTYPSPLGDREAIYVTGSTLFKPGHGKFRIPLEHITPRFDLPRAWNPDGTPPAGRWHDDYTDVAGTIVDPLTNAVEDVDAPPHTEVRRWIGEWEQ